MDLINIFDACGKFLLSSGSGFGKNIQIFVGEMNLLVHIENKKKYILVFGKSPTDGLSAEKEYSIK